MTCEPIPPGRGFVIPSHVPHTKSHTVTVGGSQSSNGFPHHGLGADVLGRAGMLQDRLEAARLFLGHIHLQEKTVNRVNIFR